MRCSPTRPPRWRRRWLSSGLPVLSRGRPACPSGCAWRCIREPALERDGDYFGPVVNRVARLLAVGHGGQVLVSGATYELLADRLPGGIGFRDLGEHRLKDLGRAERVFQVTGPGLAEGFGPLRSLDDPALRHNLPSQATSFVGRAAELAELRSLVSGGSRLVTIAGPGGIGKSRLALQVAAEVLDGDRRGGVAGRAGAGGRTRAGGPHRGRRASGPRGAGTPHARHPGRGGRRPLPAGGPGQRRARARRGRQAGRRPDAVLPAGVSAGHEQGAAGRQRGARLPGSLACRSRPPISPPPAGWPLSSRCSCSPSAP